MNNTQFVTRMYSYALGTTTPDPAGLNYWVGRLTAGQNLSNLMVEYINAVLDYAPNGDTNSTAAQKQAAIDAQSMIKNKVAASRYFVDQVGDLSNVPLDGNGNPNINSAVYQASLDVLSGVTKDPASLEASYSKSIGYQLDLFFCSILPETCNSTPTLPPDPGAASTATLTGVDSNNNNVRDEVEISLADIASNQEFFNQNMGLAATLQSVINTEIITGADAQAKSREIYCKEIARTDAAKDDLPDDVLRALIYDTPERLAKLDKLTSLNGVTLTFMDEVSCN